MSGPDTEYLLPYEFLIHAAAAWPNVTAVEEGTEKLTYHELFEASVKLAHTLRSAGIECGNRVALLMPKSIHAFAVIHAVLAVGAVYVPIDPTWPAVRIRGIVDYCCPQLLITDSQATASKLDIDCSSCGDIYLVNTSNGDATPWSFSMEKECGHSFHLANEPSDPAYILFTSGSTGRPKGVTVSNSAAAAFPRWAVATFNLCPGQRVACPAQLSFDLSTLDLLGAILGGATVVIPPRGALLKPALFTEFLKDKKISVWYSVPSLLVLMMERGNLLQTPVSTLRHLLYAGEVFPIKYLHLLRQYLCEADIWNLYGPTETNVVTYHKLPRIPTHTDDTPIGIPCSYASIRIKRVGSHANSADQRGELLVASESLMSGYWNHPEETNRVFVELDDNSCGVRRYYCTGDQCEQRGDSNYYFLGRLDRQIKRRGFRIELVEIEAALNQISQVIKSAVVATSNANDRSRIVAFVQCRNDITICAMELKSQLAKQLPLFMIPDEINIVKELPRNSRGKIDYHTLERKLLNVQTNGY